MILTMDRKITGVIFDVDGTLVDSNDAHASAWADALGEFGFAVDWQEVRQKIGKGGDKVIPEITGLDPDSERGERLGARRSQIFAERYLPKLKPFPKVPELLDRLEKAKLEMVVASSAKDAELTPLLYLAGAERLLPKKTSADDAERSKPDPDIIVAALEKAGRKPHEMLMIGDTPYDVEAAKKAGVQTIAFRSGGWDDASLSDAIAIYDGVAALLADFDASPLNRA